MKSFVRIEEIKKSDLNKIKGGTNKTGGVPPANDDPIPNPTTPPIVPPTAGMPPR